ncbi:MAG TPA: hypothetical protein VFN96_02730 [Gemmatimonadales bacterium]|nr:hypothetical protein [Gemmatimonadales bacterium]
MTKGLLPPAVLLLALAAACGSADGSGGTPTQPPPAPSPDVTLGRTAFLQECASCHNSHDGFDLAFFSYPDTAIIRRAVKHVNQATAQNIATYIGWLSTPHVPRSTRVFQPKGTVLSGDVQFATALFGQDIWPTMSTAQLKAINPVDVAVPLSLPPWSDEASNVDWLAEDPPPAGFMGAAGGRATAAVAAYHAAPTAANLTKAVDAFYGPDEDAANPAAPCLFNDPSRVDYFQCFEIRKWASSLVGQHMLRNGGKQSAGAHAHELWWAVGEAARMAEKAGSTAIANNRENQRVWFYLGWIFEPGLHQSFYLENLLPPRVAVFVALRGQVSRPAGSWEEHKSIYDDLFRAVQHAPAHWANAVATFGLKHVLERLNSGDRPAAAAQKSHATAMIDAAISAAAAKVTSAQLSALQSLANQAKSKL